MSRVISACVLALLGLVLIACSPKDSKAVLVRNASELAEAIRQANAGGDKEIVLADGVYRLGNMLWVEAEGVEVRSASGRREAVILEGQGMKGGLTHIFNLAGSHFSVRDITLRRVSQHAVQLQPDVDFVMIKNVHILDTGEQMIKVAYDPHDLSKSSDNGVLENCLLEYSAGVGPQSYIGGIDAHNARNWIVRNNIMKNVRSPSGEVAEHAIHFWSNSQHTLVENNIIVNCDRGIGFGLGQRGHGKGIIRNNMVYHDGRGKFADVGISLESSPGTQVYNNTIYLQSAYPHAIEFRFAATRTVLIANNLTNKAIAARDGAVAHVTHNFTRAQKHWFVQPSSGDLHLRSAFAEVVDRGKMIPGLSVDIDGDFRPQGKGVDLGADEYVK